MSKNKYEVEIDDQIKYLKKDMLDCLEDCKEHLDITYTNYKKFGIVPIHFGAEKASLHSFELLTQRLYDLELLKNKIKINEQRTRRSKNRNKINIV